MTYQKLLETVSNIISNDKIEKIGLSLSYSLPSNEFNTIHQEVINQTNPYSTNFESVEEFEVFLGPILVKFKKI